MQLQDLKRDYYLFDPGPYGRIMAMVDFSNVHYWAKAFWPQENKEYFKKDIDINKLAEIIDLIRPASKYFYYGHYKEYPLFPQDHNLNIKYRQSIFRIDKARKAGFITRTKDIKEIRDFDEEGKFLGKFNKCNFDIEMAMDVLLKMHEYDSLFLWSGDSDFHSLSAYVKSKGKKVITICARDFASEELRDNSDLFIPADPLRDLIEFSRYKNTPGKTGGNKYNPNIP